jgi:hypothetical protein
MKYLFILILALPLMQSCDKPDDASAQNISFQFIVKNSTSKNVDLFLYTSSDNLFKTITIKSLDSQLVDEGNVSPVGGTTLSITNSLDSAVFKFIDSKILIQTVSSRGINDTINNVLSSVFYKSISPGETIKKKLFILTENDYLRAK